MSAAAEPSAKDVGIIGGGLVAAAIAYGLARRGRQVVLWDEGDQALRAARGNFGLIWAQSKGDGVPAYQDWTLTAADAWPDFAAALRAEAGIDPGHRRPGGVHLCLSEEEFEARAALMARLAEQDRSGRFQYRMLRHNELAQQLPGIGPEVTGGSYTPVDGDCDPLALLTALHRALLRRGVDIRTGARVERIEPLGDGFRILGQTVRKAVVAAGLGGPDLVRPLGLDVAVRPVRGQIMITEKLAPLLSLPTTSLRQTAQGGLQIGDSLEEAGFDTGTTLDVMQMMADRARRCFPALEKVRILRAWGALRVMTADGLPIYAQSLQHPGLFYATCHSGVTLAPNHAQQVAAWIDGDGPAPDEAFAPTRSSLQTGPRHVPFT